MQKSIFALLGLLILVPALLVGASTLRSAVNDEFRGHCYYEQHFCYATNKAGDCYISERSLNRAHAENMLDVLPDGCKVLSDANMSILTKDVQLIDLMSVLKVCKGRARTSLSGESHDNCDSAGNRSHDTSASVSHEYKSDNGRVSGKVEGSYTQNQDQGGKGHSGAVKGTVTVDW